MSNNIRVLHYLNQFFGGVGGEEHANAPPESQDGPVGPGRLLQSMLQAAGGGSVVGTIVCGDNYIVENEDAAIAAIGDIFDRYKPDLVVAGPAFDAGRYGVGCALVCRAATERGIPAITGMHPENTGVLTHRLHITAVPTSTEASGMQSAIQAMVGLGVRLAAGEELGSAVDEGYIPRGIRKEKMHEMNGADRAFNMMMARVNAEDYVSEVLVPGYETVAPAPPIRDLSSANLALVTSGGLVPKGNPDNQVGGRARDFFSYSIDGLDRLSTDDWESVHMGFSTVHLNTIDPSYVLPLPIVRDMQEQGVIAGVYPNFLSTTGNGTPVTTARRMGSEIGQELREAGIDGVLLVAT